MTYVVIFDVIVKGTLDEKDVKKFILNSTETEDNKVQILSSEMSQDRS